MTTQAVGAAPSAARGLTLAIPGWTILRWIVAICVAVVAVFPIWWMINVVFADPVDRGVDHDRRDVGTPERLDPRAGDAAGALGVVVRASSRAHRDDPALTL